jgi:hypothetical protein
VLKLMVKCEKSFARVAYVAFSHGDEEHRVIRSIKFSFYFASVLGMAISARLGSPACWKWPFPTRSINRRFRTLFGYEKGRFPSLRAKKNI